MKNLPLTLLLMALAPALPAQEEGVPAPAPAVQEEPAIQEEPQLAAYEQTFITGLSKIRELGEGLAQIQNLETAENAARQTMAGLDELKAWQKEMGEALADPEAAALYNARYRATAEKICLAISDVAIRLTSVHYCQSEELRTALLRVAKELPAACGLRQNAQWTCSGTVMLAMLDEVLGGIISEKSAKEAVPAVQEIVDALLPWRDASRPAGEAIAARRYLKSRQSYIDQMDLVLRMQIKRITYAECFRTEGLGLPLLQARDCLADICALPREEQHIREGIVLLGVLENTLSQVKDTNSARAATAPIMRLSNELQQWGQGFNALPEPDDETRSLYEKRYLPRIEQLNDRIKAQGKRIASAEFYRCHELTSTLLHLILNFQ